MQAQRSAKKAQPITWLQGTEGIGYRVSTDGKTRSYCIDYKDGNGKRVRTFRDPENGQPMRTEKQAKVARAKLTVDESKGLELVRSTITLNELAPEWLGRQITAADGTIDGWSINLRLHVLPALGRLEVAKINEQHLRNLMLAKRREGKAESTIAHIMQPLTMILDEAVIQRILATNPWSRVPKKEKPKPASTEAAKRILTLDEIDALLRAARESEGLSARMEALVHTYVYAGLRLSEALGLAWEDIDFETGVLHVRLQLSRKTYQRVALKSAASVRDIPLGRELRTALRAWKLASLHSGPEDFVFATATGTPMKQRNAYRNVMVIAENAGINTTPENPKLPNVDVHALRHVFASAMIRAYKGDGQIVAKLLGHADAELLLKRYAHQFEAVRGGTSIAEHAAMIDAAFGG